MYFCKVKFDIKNVMANIGKFFVLIILTFSLVFNSVSTVKKWNVLLVHFFVQSEVSCEKKNTNNQFKKNKEVVMDKTNVSENYNTNELENKKTKNCLAYPL